MTSEVMGLSHQPPALVLLLMKKCYFMHKMCQIPHTNRRLRPNMLRGKKLRGRATCCGQQVACCLQQVACCAQHVASSNMLRATSNMSRMLRWCKRGFINTLTYFLPPKSLAGYVTDMLLVCPCTTMAYVASTSQSQKYKVQY